VKIERIKNPIARIDGNTIDMKNRFRLLTGILYTVNFINLKDIPGLYDSDRKILSIKYTKSTTVFMAGYRKNSYADWKSLQFHLSCEILSESKL
jgi:hypothetical protein